MLRFEDLWLRCAFVEDLLYLFWVIDREHERKRLDPCSNGHSSGSGGADRTHVEKHKNPRIAGNGSVKKQNKEVVLVND